MYKIFSINQNIINKVNEIETSLKNDFDKIDEIYEYNQLKVLKSFIDSKISESHFAESTGYGYNDVGRDKIDEVYSRVFNTESALVRQQIVSGTHAISLSMFSILRPGDHFLSITGLPYDTLSSTIGLNNEESSLREFNVDFEYVDLINNDFDYSNIKSKIKNNTKLIFIQRSRGYTNRCALSLTKIKKAIEFIKNINNKLVILVDNCYGEFVNIYEPTDFGADILCGSLIKNPGGSLALSGGYIVGKKEYINKCAFRLTAPGIGNEVGVNFNQNRNILQGLYIAPQIVSNALKIVLLYGKVFNEHNFVTIPKYNEELNDIVISIKFGDKNLMEDFCNIIQESSPIDSFVKPICSDMPGYNNKIIMAAGCFVSGASIELSCDAPVKEPYYVYLQGGLSYYQGKLALMKFLNKYCI